MAIQRRRRRKRVLRGVRRGRPPHTSAGLYRKARAAWHRLPYTPEDQRNFRYAHITKHGDA